MYNTPGADNMTEIKLPELNKDLLNEIDDLNAEVNKLDAELMELQQSVPKVEQILNTLEAEKEELINKANDLPELYDKPLKAKVKEIEKTQKIIQQKKEQIKMVRGNLREIEKVTIPDNENRLYLPYFINLKQMYWNFQQKAYDENSSKYEKYLTELKKILTGKHMNRYNLIRQKVNKLESLTPDNTR